MGYKRDMIGEGGGVRRDGKASVTKERVLKERVLKRLISSHTQF